jgi:hypothetical protein
MRQLIGHIGSLAVGVLITAAGLVYDARTLVYVGSALFGLAAVLWLHDWATRVPATPTPAASRAAPASNRKETIKELTQATYLGRHTLKFDFHAEGIAAILPRAEAALLSAHKEFGVRIPNPHQNPATRLETGVRLLEQVVPLLAAGHIEEARERAENLSEEADEAARLLKD